MGLEQRPHTWASQDLPHLEAVTFSQVISFGFLWTGLHIMAIYYLLHVSGLLPVRDLDIGERSEAVLESVTSITGRVPVMCNVM